MNDGASAAPGPGLRTPRGRALGRLARGGIVVPAVLALLTVGPAAFADLLAPSGGTLASGRADVLPCGDISSAVITYDVTGGLVSSATVTGLPASCEGSSLWLALTSNGAALALAGPAVVSAGAAAVSTPTAPPSTAVTDARIVLIG